MRPKKINDFDLLESCTQSIMELGPHTFTLRSLSSYVGISPAALIKRFGSKEALLNKCISYHINQMGNKALDEGITLEDFFSVELKNIDNNNFIQNLSLLAQDMREAKLRKVARIYFQGFNEKLKVLITKDSRFDKIHNVETFVSQLETIYHGSIIQGAFLTNTSIRKNAYDQISKYIEDTCNVRIKLF